jgi:hypothetical protein
MLQQDIVFRNFKANIISAYNNHYSKINDYVINLQNAKIADENTKIKVMFMIEDITRPGNCENNNGQLISINLLYLDFFQDLLEKSNLLNYIFYSFYFNNERFLWFMDLRSIKKFKKKQAKVINFVPIATHSIGIIAPFQLKKTKR